MKKILLFISLSIIFICNSFAQPKDVEGYREARWGMTEQQVLDVFKGEAVKLISKKTTITGNYSSIGIKQAVLDSNNYQVNFYFEPNNKTLQQVNVSLTSAIPRKKMATAFNSLINDLKKTYGEPTKTKDKPMKNGRNLGGLWVFPTTVIMAEGIFGGSDQIIVMYSKNVGKTFDNY